MMNKTAGAGPRPVNTLPLETLQNRDFTLTVNTGAGSLQTIAEHIVPRGEARTLVRYPGRLTLGAKDTFDGDGATTTFALSTSVAKNLRGFGSTEPVKASGDGGATYATYTEGVAGPGEFSVDFAADTATFGTAPAIGVDNVIVYFPFVVGKWTLEVFTSNERRHETFANGTVRNINSRPQDDVNSPFMPNSQSPPLPQDFLIRIQLDSAGIVNWDAANPFSQIELIYVRTPLTGMTADQINQAAHLIGA